MTSRGISILAAFALSAAAQTAGGDANLRNRVVDLFQSDRYQEALTEALRLVQVTKSQYRQSPASTGARVAYADALGLEGTVYGAMEMWSRRRDSFSPQRAFLKNSNATPRRRRPAPRYAPASGS